MAGVADVVHETQGAVREEAFLSVIFQEDAVAGHAGGFAEHDGRVFRVMEDVDEEDAIESLIREGEFVAVEFRDGDGGVWADENIHAFRSDVGAEFAEAFGESAIAAADIEQARVCGDERGEVIAQYVDAAGEDVFPVDGVERSHGKHRTSSIELPTSGGEEIPNSKLQAPRKLPTSNFQRPTFKGDRSGALGMMKLIGWRMGSSPSP